MSTFSSELERGRRRQARPDAARGALDRVVQPDGNFLRTLATPEPIKDWSLTGLKEKLIKIGAKVVRHGGYVAFQMLRSPFREFSLPRSCVKSRNCDRHLIQHRHERAGS